MDNRSHLVDDNRGLFAYNAGMVPFRSRGLSLAEMLTSLALLAGVGLVLTGLFLRLHLSVSKTSDQEAALLIAERLLKEAGRCNPADWTELVSQVQATSPPDFASRLTAEQISPPDAPMGELYRLDVQVQWWANAERRDYGKLSLNLSRFVYLVNRK